MIRQNIFSQIKRKPNNHKAINKELNYRNALIYNMYMEKGLNINEIAYLFDLNRRTINQIVITGHKLSAQQQKKTA